MELWKICLTVLLPLILLVGGLFFRIGLPRKVNWFAGYRTPMTCKNQDTWVFAHKYSGKLMIIFSIITLALCIVGIILTEKSAFELEFAVLLGVSWGGTLVTVLVTIISTEIALRKEFDKNGIRRR